MGCREAGGGDIEGRGGGGVIKIKIFTSMYWKMDFKNTYDTIVKLPKRIFVLKRTISLHALLKIFHCPQKGPETPPPPSRTSKMLRILAFQKSSFWLQFT